MNPGTLGEWTGERWAPIHDDEFTRRVNHILATHMAAALADPDLGDHAADHYQAGNDHDAFRAASKALAGYLLEKLTAQEQS